MSPAPRLSFKVPFDEADGEGIVFFGNYFRLAHRALEQWLPQMGISWESWFANSDFGVPLRHVEADYLGPLRPGQEFFVSVRVEKLGESSVVFGYLFENAEGKALARLQTVHIFISRADGKKASVPEKIRSRLA
jgi:YbgC/YbaW family acyl-CoA thioester hydrolase